VALNNNADQSFAIRTPPSYTWQQAKRIAAAVCACFGVVLRHYVLNIISHLVSEYLTKKYNTTGVTYTTACWLEIIRVLAVPTFDRRKHVRLYVTISLLVRPSGRTLALLI